MKLSLFKRFTQEDHPDVPEGFLQQLNKVLEDISTALQSRLTFSENIQSEVRKLDIRNGTVTPIRLQKLDRNPIGVLLLKSSYLVDPTFTWAPSSGRDLTVDVTLTWTPAPATDPTVTLLFIGN